MINNKGGEPKYHDINNKDGDTGPNESIYHIVFVLKIQKTVVAILDNSGSHSGKWNVLLLPLVYFVPALQIGITLICINFKLLVNGRKNTE